MGNRHKDFNILIAEQFENLEFSQEYVMYLLNEEKLTVEEVLRDSIKAMGIKSFSVKAEAKISYVSEFVSSKRKWSKEKIMFYIEDIFSLKLEINAVVA